MVHPGRIHGYVERKFRHRQLWENVAIIIPVILCPIARAEKSQYTKRLLPDFLTPYSVIRLDYLLRSEIPFRSVVVHENFEALTTKDRRILTNVVDKQFTDLDDFQKSGADYIRREIAY